MPRPFLVLQHIACEPPGAYEDELREWGGELHRVELDAGDELPDWRGYSAIIAMGGPMGAYEEDANPWLAPEKRMIAEAVRAHTPFWGVCLGAQLLAASLGAKVYPGGSAEVGVLDVELTREAEDDPVFAGVPTRFRALQWHGDTWELPAGATRLARSDAYEQQAFKIQHAYGVQFHIEVSSALATEWGDVPAYGRSLEAILGPGALPRLIDEVAAREAEMVGLARRLFRTWLDSVVAPAQIAVAGARA
jgi:GMP synthase-like glutamine amidotransferase